MSAVFLTRRTAIAAACGLALPGTQAAATRSPSGSANAGPIWGVGMHLPSGQTNAAEVRQLLGRLGISSFRDDVQWSQLEKEPGLFRFAGANAQIQDLILGVYGPLQPGLLVLNYDNRHHFLGMPRTDRDRDAFARYAKAVFAKFGNRVHGYEVWNEWNLGAGSRGGYRGTVEEYLLLVQSVRRVADEVGVTVPIVTGSVGNRDMVWIRRFVQLGGLQVSDGFSVHPYNHTARDASAEEVVRWLDGLATVLGTNANGLPVPIYVTEIGWPTHSKGTDETTAALRLFKLYLLLQSRRHIAGVWWYDLFDDGSDHNNQEHRFGLMREDHSPKPAFHALAQFSRLVGDRSVVRSIASATGSLVQLSEAPGQPNLIAWRHEGASKAVLSTIQGCVAKRLPLEEALGPGDQLEPLSSTKVALDAWPILLLSPDPSAATID